MCDPTTLPSTEQTDRDPLWLVRCSCQQTKGLQCAGELKSEGNRAENDSEARGRTGQIVLGLAGLSNFLLQFEIPLAL